MSIIGWIVFGALAGWVASMIAGTNERQGCLMNIIIGIVGSFIGGVIVWALTGANMAFGWDWRSFLVAVVGAVVLLFITGAARRRA